MRETICMLVHGPFPVGEPRVARQARAAANAGYHVDVISMRRPGEPRDESRDGIEIHRLPLEHERGLGLRAVVLEYVGFTALAAATLWRLARRRHYQVIHVHNPPDFLLFAALPAKLAFGARLLFDVHDLAPDLFAERFGSGTVARLANRLLPTIERLALRSADAVVTVHEPYARELRVRGARDVTVVMNSVDPDLLPTSDDEMPHGPKFRVVYHGTVTPWYGVDLLIDAAGAVGSEIPNLVVEIFGEGDAVPSLRKRSRQLGLDERVRFYDRWLPQRDVLSRVRSASVGVIPNRPSRLNRYALSSKLLEYVELGIPVAAAGLPTLREHFTDDEVLFFTPGDADALAAALLTIAREPEVAQTRAMAARRRASAYAWETNAARYVQLIADLSREVPAPNEGSVS
jgi:glycosyltransferase involved in cell wall biosynthesis